MSYPYDDPCDPIVASERDEQLDRAWESPEYQRGPFDYFEPAAYWQQPLEISPAASAGAGRTDSRPETSGGEQRPRPEPDREAA